MIDEKKLIERFKELKDCDSLANMFIKDVIKEIQRQPKIGKWIPCSERMPEKPFGCLVTVIDTNPMNMEDFENILPYHVGYDGKQWNDADGEKIPFEVIAWQPLPEAYHEPLD